MGFLSSIPSISEGSFFFFFAFLLLPRAECQMKFTSIYQGMAVTGLVGSSVNFTWSFSGVYSIDWGIKQANAGTLTVRLVSIDQLGKVTFPSSSGSVDYNGRVNGIRTGDTSSGQVVFTLSNIKTTDANLYGCVLYPPSPVQVALVDYVNLRVEELPHIVHPNFSQTTYNEGGRVSIRCGATSTPEPYVRWIYNGQVKNPGLKTAQISFSRISRSDAGIYICRANNSVGTKEKRLTVVVNYAATITSISSSVFQSWRGQVVSIKCVSDGIPTPTLSWHTPGGTRFNPVIEKENTVIVTMNSDEDFGLYNCTADNGFAPASQTVYIQQIKAPGSPSITTRNEDVQATSVTVKWTEPTDDGGSPVTAYRVVILQGNAEKNNENITDPNTRNFEIGGLQKYTNYTVKVFARNIVFEGEAGQRIIKTKYEGIPAAAEIIGLPAETKETKLTLEWLEPQNNGAAIEQYNVYQRTVRDNGTHGKWNKLNEIKNPLVREVVVQFSKGKEYEFVVTAINRFGESLQEEEKIKKIIVLGEAPAAVVFTVKVKDDEVTFKWEEPENNGGVIAKYSIYQRTTSDEKWENLKDLTEISRRGYSVKVQKRKAYEFVITATNKFGESSKTNFKKVDVLGDKSLPVGTRGKLNVAVIAGPAAAGVLLILGVVLFCVWWKRRKTSSDAGSSAADLRGPNPDDFEDGYEAVGAATWRGSNPDDFEDGYEAVGAASAARQLQAYGPAADVTYAQPDMSQTKSRRKVTGVYPKMGKVKEATQKPQKPFVIQNPSAKHTMNDAQTYATPISGDYMPLNPRTRSWEVMREQVDIIKVIGKGAFSQVAQATVKNARGYQEYITVAVKMLKANAPASDRKDLLSELDLMKKLKPHPHVIKLIGCVTESDPLLVLIEYVPFGDLLGYLRNSRGLNDKYYKDPDAKPQSNLTAEQLMKFAWQIADGMCYLSSKKIIHRDLAARNVLVGEGEVCKITDFGMARNVHQDDIYSRKSRGRLPVKWTAYEALFYGQYTTQSDVWSYGVLLYEILTIGGSPYPTVKAREIAMKIQEGYRMPKPRHIDEKLYEIMLRCWEENPGDRPTFEKLRKTMKDMERSHRTYVNLTQYDDSLYANINDLAAE